MMALRGCLRGAAWSWSRSDPDAKQVAEGTQVVDQGAVGHGVGHAVVGGPGDADRAGNGEDLWEMSGSATAAVFTVGDVADGVAAGLDEPVRADDDAESSGVGLIGGEAADEIGPVSPGLVAVAPLALNVDDLGCGGENLEQLAAGMA